MKLDNLTQDHVDILFDKFRQIVNAQVNTFETPTLRQVRGQLIVNSSYEKRVLRCDIPDSKLRFRKDHNDSVTSFMHLNQLPTAPDYTQQKTEYDTYAREVLS